ncbi:hypothetical protein [Capnocytophaga gingivalis]|uniref:hypothetical protein n=1 Tax=Capnocytophaga gingivalis TaxID=1017 RepID=UPI0028D6180B|nr:hypothetical protein [Capnocytophaga gingivalis]
MFEKLLEIIRSDEFRVRLVELNNNFFNLKQELHIRDLLLVLFNKYHSQEGFRAIAEYPRKPETLEDGRISHTRVDLSLVDRENKGNPIKIELKYHFPKDKGGFLNYEESIQKHFTKRGSDGFILIVCDSDTKGRENFESIWLNGKTMFSNLSSDDLKWKDNLKKKFENKDLEAKSYFHEIKVDKPFETTYHFFILEKK